MSNNNELDTLKAYSSLGKPNNNNEIDKGSAFFNNFNDLEISNDFIGLEISNDFIGLEIPSNFRGLENPKNINADVFYLILLGYTLEIAEFIVNNTNGEL